MDNLTFERAKAIDFELTDLERIMQKMISNQAYSKKFVTLSGISSADHFPHDNVATEIIDKAYSDTINHYKQRLIDLRKELKSL